MAGRYTTGDKVQWLHVMPIGEQPSRSGTPVKTTLLLGGIVLAEEPPGLYEVQTSLGLRMKLLEADLTAATEQVRDHIVAIIGMNG